MDSHLFRRLAAEFERSLAGRRIQKVYGPAPGVSTLDLGAGEGGRFLLLRFGNKDPLLFLASEKPRNPDNPDARAMWLRKRLLGRRLRAQHCDWPRRQLAWELSGKPREQDDGRQDDRGALLLLCLRQGLSLRDELPEDFGREPHWPDFKTLFAALHTTDQGEVEELWRECPQISPVLRRTLAAHPPDVARALYASLQRAEPSDCFVYVHEQDGRSMAESLAWRLPESLREGRDERRFPTAMDAAAHAGSVTLFSQLARQDDAQERAARKKGLKRLKRALAKVEQEEGRMRGLMGLRRKGQALQAALWSLDPERKLHHVEVPDYEAMAREQMAGQEEAPPLRIDLDPSLSIAANMERFFRLAAKGERGLPMVQARRQLLMQELDGVRQGKIAPRGSRQQPGTNSPPLPESRKKGKDLTLQRFRTSDGFLVLRGRNKAANHKLLSQAASPYDIWFHAQDGPGAHLVLKRDHPKQELPRRSLLEAAALAGLKGWQGRDDKARVICALVKDVRKIKGAELGRVAVDKVLEAFQVALDPALEERLRVE